MENESTLIGQFLVAMPSLTDPRFEKSVILITSHNPEGATGLIINKPLTKILPELHEDKNDVIVNCQSFHSKTKDDDTFYKEIVDVTVNNNYNNLFIMFF